MTSKTVFSSIYSKIGIRAPFPILLSIIFLDETGIDEYLYRKYGWAKRGEKVPWKIMGRRYKRTSIVAGKREKEILAPLQYSGTMNSKLFEYWFKEILMKEVKKGDVIVLDNARFHRKKELEKIAKKYKCKILFLPPYSPDLNPKEKFWS